MKQLLRILLISIFALIAYNTQAQYIKMGGRAIVAGYVFEESTSEPLPYVNVYIKQTRQGTITDTSGYFIISAKINDTLTFSSLGYDRKYVVLTDSASESMKPLIVFLDTRIYQINSVDIIALKRYKQLEYEIINMKLEDDGYIYAANNFPFRPKDLDYYTRVNAPGFGLVFSPISALYELFSKEGKERQKLEEIQSRDYLSELIDKKVSSSFISEITGMSLKETNIFLSWCNFSPEFILKLNEYDLISIIIYKHKQYSRIQHIP